jgi:hypothetical protein
MNNSLVDIQHPTGNWLARHDLNQAGGPLILQENGTTLLENFHHRYDDLAGDLLVPDKVRLFRKSGAAVFSSDGHFPFGAELALRQTIRYAANHARITTDLRWKKGASLKKEMAIGSARLPGKWDKVLVLQADGEPPSWQALTPGTFQRFSPLPLSLAFRNQQGQSLEIGTGDDLWRWQNGLLPQAQSDAPYIELSIQSDGILLQRLVTINPNEEECFPEPRDYRFTSFLAWSAPALEQDAGPLHEPIALEIRRHEGLSRKQLLDCGNNPCVSLDFNQLELPRQAKHSLGQGYCWESKITQKSVRRLIRQLADFSKTGYLQITGGLTPGLCDDPVHCSRKNKTLHWDLSAILDLTSWTQQRLGDGWTVNVQQKPPYKQMPSLSCLAAPNGFRLQNDNNDQEDDD